MRFINVPCCTYAAQDVSAGEDVAAEGWHKREPSHLYYLPFMQLQEHQI